MPEQKEAELDDFLNDEEKDVPVKKSAISVTEIKKAAAKAAEKPAKAPKKEFQSFKNKYVPPEEAASIGLSLKMLPPITRRRTAVYEMMDAGIKIDPRVISGPAYIEPRPFEMVPTYELDDVGESDRTKRRKIMVWSSDINVLDYYNSTAKLTQQANSVVNLKLEMPTFINGQIALSVDKDYIKYCWMELHPRNANNKWRDKTVPALFKRVDIEYQSPHLKLIRMDLAMDAEKYVIRLNNEELINLGAAFGIPATSRPSEIRLELRTMARQDPQKVLFKSPDPKAATMMNILSGIDHGLLDYSPETQEYFFTDEKDSIFVVPMGDTPLEALSSYLISEEGREYKAQLEEVLSFWK